MRRTILFLCTGDTCRGPMAVGYMQKMLLEGGVKNVEARSAGVMTVTGLLATPESLQMLESEGVDLKRHRSSPMSPELLKRCDLILGMTPLHVQQALRLEPSVRGRVFLLKEYTKSDIKKVQIDDPMGNTLEVYKKVFSDIRSALKRLAKMSFVTGKPEEKEPEKKAPAVAKKPAAKAPAPVAAKKPAAKAPAHAARHSPPPSAAKKVSGGAKTAKSPAKPRKKAGAAKSVAAKTGKPAKSGAKRGAAAGRSRAAKPVSSGSKKKIPSKKAPSKRGKSRKASR